jgi:hypothetical protein
MPLLRGIGRTLVVGAIALGVARQTAAQAPAVAAPQPPKAAPA